MERPDWALLAPFLNPLSAPSHVHAAVASAVALRSAMGFLPRDAIRSSCAPPLSAASSSHALERLHHSGSAATSSISERAHKVDGVMSYLHNESEGAVANDALSPGTSDVLSQTRIGMVSTVANDGIRGIRGDASHGISSIGSGGCVQACCNGPTAAFTGAFQAALLSPLKRDSLYTGCYKRQNMSRGSEEAVAPCCSCSSSSQKVAGETRKQDVQLSAASAGAGGVLSGSPSIQRNADAAACSLSASSPVGHPLGGAVCANMQVNRWGLAICLPRYLKRFLCVLASNLIVLLKSAKNDARIQVDIDRTPSKPTASKPHASHSCRF